MRRISRSEDISRCRRSGGVLIAVLVCMSVAATILLCAVEKSLRCRRQLRNEAQLEQVRWLVDAGIRKAVANLQKDDKYSGERITVSPEMYESLVADVEIDVSPTKSRGKSSKESVRILVTATLRRQESTSPKVKRVKELVFDRPTVEK